MNDLYLIGNGFDLAHELKTSYNDFLLWYLKAAISRITPNRVFDDDLLEIKRPAGISLIDHTSLNELLDVCDKFQITIIYKHSFFEKLVKNYRDYRWVDVEYEYYIALVEIFEGMERSNELRNPKYVSQVLKLNNCFKSIKEKLLTYLETIDFEPLRENVEIKEILYEGTGSEGGSSGEKLFLNFNYTSTLENYTRRYLNNQYTSINIHGILGNLLEYVIFGYGDEMDTHYEKIEHLNIGEFLNNFKSFSYFKTSNYQKLIRFIESRDFTVKILGHSCGLSDRVLLNTIFEHENCKAIKIYYHQKNEMENDYFEKTQEISRHFTATKKAEMRKKIVSFDYCRPLLSIYK